MINYSSNFATENNNINNKDEEMKNEVFLHKYNLFQQFFVIGIEPKILHLIDKVDLKTIPEQMIGPKIITKYPNKTLPYLNNSDSLIASHCFPKGFQNSIVECRQNELNEKLLQTKDFVFSLDNCQINTNDTLKTNKVYYFCYMFYEKFDDYQAWLNLKKNFNQKNNSSNRNNSSSAKRYLLIPKVICISSFSPYIYQSKLILHYLKKNVDKSSYNKYLEKNKDTSSPVYNNNNSNNMPIDKIIEGLIYNLPGLPRANFMLKINKNNFISEEELSQTNENEIIFFNSPYNKKPKPIINYSRLMHFFKIEEIFEIIKYILLEEPILFFCNDIEDLTYTIQGFLSLIYPFEYYYPVVEVLPEQNYTFVNLYKSFIFGINQAYSEDFFVFKGINFDEQKNVNIVLIENRFSNILNSNEKEKEKKNIIIHIKPNNMKYLAISQQKINDTISEIKDFYVKKRNMIATENREDEKIDDKNDEKKIKLPAHYFTKCCKKFEANLEYRFKDIRNKIKEKDKFLTVQKYELEKEKIFNDEIIENFLYFFISIFLHYQQFCTKFLYSYVDDNEPNTYFSKTGNYHREKELEKKYYTNSLTINDLFNCDLFLDEVPNLDKPFYSKFLQTKIFFNFMKKKIFPISLQDKLDVLFFDDKVNEKLSRESGMKKIETKFLEYDISNITGNINVGCLSKHFSDDFKQFASQEKNKYKILNYFQYLVVENTDNNQLKNNSYSMENYYSTNSNTNIDFNIKLYYFVFPKLLNDDIFYKENKKEEDSKNIWNTTNFTYKNSNCLYNQYEKEGNIIIKDENLVKNYYNYYYTINPCKSYTRPIEHYIKTLYLQYFAKTFYLIPFSKRNHYFNYLIHFVINNKKILDENSIMMMFNTLMVQGDRYMAKDFYQFVKNKTYSSFLMLRDKTRLDKNYSKCDNSSAKKIINNECDNDIDNLLNDQNENTRSNSIFSSSPIRLSGKSNLKNPKKSNLGFERDVLDKISKANIYFIMEDKSKVFEREDNFSFSLNLFCNKKIEDNCCNQPLESNIENIFDENKKYIEFKCTKCKKINNIEISCIYKEDNSNEEYNIKTNLISPATLLEDEWFKETQQLNLNKICEKHLDSFICALFYFYDQGLLCDFLVPKESIKNNLKIEKNNDCNIQIQDEISEEKKNNNNPSEKIEIDIIEENKDNTDYTDIFLNLKDQINDNDIKNKSEINNISNNISNLNISSLNINNISTINSKSLRGSIEIKNMVPNSRTSREGSIFDISDQRLNFFEFKAQNKKPSSLVRKKKNNPDSKKKTVGFTNKSIKIAHKKNNISYSTFLNK